jgi:hypothetical protein
VPAQPHDDNVANPLVGTGPLAAAANRLAQRYVDLVPDEVIRQTLVDVYTKLANSSTVTAFLPILAERAAANRLEAVVRHHPTAPARR